MGEPWFNWRMLKTEAIELLGGSVPSAAAEIGISYQAVVKWPDVLPSRIADRVLAALARKRGLADELAAPSSNAVRVALSELNSRNTSTVG